MIGGEIHEHIINQLDARFRAKRFRTARQVPARSGRNVGYIDLVAEDENGRFICIEVEMSARRVAADIVKVSRLSQYVSCRRHEKGKCELWIVVPNDRVKKAARRALQRLEVDEEESLSLLTYGQALSRVANCISFSSEALLEEKATQKRISSAAEGSEKAESPDHERT